MQSKLYHKAILLLLLLLTSPAAVFSQGLNPQSILELINTKYGIDTESMQICSMYIIDEVPFEGLALEQELANHTEASIGFVEVVDASAELGDDQCMWRIHIITKDSQTEVEKERLLLQAKAYYASNIPRLTGGDFKCKLCKAFKIENTLYSVSEVKAALNKLSAKDISFIAWYSQPVNPALYGSGASNGLIEIFLNVTGQKGSK